MVSSFWFLRYLCVINYPVSSTGRSNLFKERIEFNCVRSEKMAIIVRLDVMLAKRKVSVTELSEKVGITMANLSILKNGKAKAIRFSTLDKICEVLNCQPGDIVEYVKEAPAEK